MSDEYPNKRRRGRGKERVRVTRACDACKRKKLRCSGTLPCSLCLQSGANCEYNADYTRGKKTEIPLLEHHGISSLQSPLITAKSTTNTESEKLDSKQQSSERSIISTKEISLPTAASPLLAHARVADQNHARYSLGHDTRQPNPHLAALQGEEGDEAISSRNSPEPNQTDLEGHYVGPSSGVSFLLRVQKRIHENVAVFSNGPIFNFGDAPLPKHDSHFLVLPPKNEAKMLVNRYFDFAFPTHRFLHQATIETWLDTFYSDVHGSDDSLSQAVKALLLMVMVQGKQYLSNQGPAVGQSVKSNVYFAASENHLLKETGKRVFWCAYSLDIYLSAALGRPKIFHDEDIDQDLPACASDLQITTSAILPAFSPGQSVMLAPVFHAKLVRIISGVLKELYGLKKKNLEAQAVIAQKYGSSLAEWRIGIGPFLETSNIELLQPTYQRQYNVLNLAFAHAEILLYRPFLLRNLASLGRRSGHTHSQLQQDIQTNVEKCLQAASKIAGLFKELCRSKRMYRSFWFTHYYVFCAIVVLYVYVIQHRSTPAQYLSQYLQMGEEAQKDLAQCGTLASFPQRYVVVLEELRKEALRLTSSSSTFTAVGGIGHACGDPAQTDHFESGSVSAAQATDSMRNYEHLASPEWIPNFVQDHSPASYLADMTGWSEFDSLVLTGLGELGHFFPDDTGQYQ
ncbi:uncharacterized protein N7446_002629 [Penicillium canescens]|uniref:Zn(2)-C6 fungal-type domain-containing protein n=1 Tax=Penicillium canescens TaxID=5083 RepID=A0AAD6IEG2_PENCN|nr:uncharacterized protein N7446_002629 [Penicillium canescens]KAJ6044434.1 hypothetical protein N7460_005789 [Penicillium canescens]KAJ6074852.1 hypothetical protein N7446_002629 [Penicillium canescens]